MRKKKIPLPSDSTLEQYIYDYGFDKAIELLHLTKDKAYQILHWEKKPQVQYKYNTVVDKPLHRNAAKIAEILAKHYPELKKECSFQDYNYMSQSSEDFLQRAVIRCMEVGTEDLTDESILDLFRIQFNTVRYYAKLSQWTNDKKISPLEVQNEEGEYIIPIELYNNAISEETI